jgi:hypothetical protein
LIKYNSSFLGIISILNCKCWFFCFGTPRGDVDDDVFVFVLIGQNAMTWYEEYNKF